MANKRMGSRFWHVVYGISIISLLMLIDSSGEAQVIVRDALSGNGSYSTLASAFAAINTNEQHGATISIVIEGDTVEPSEGAFLNPGRWKSITIRPQGGSWTISGAPDGAVPLIMFRGADRVTIDGLNRNGNSLTIQNTRHESQEQCSAILFDAGACNNTLTNLSILGSEDMYTIVFGDASSDSANNDNTISHCRIGSTGPDDLPARAVSCRGLLYNQNMRITISDNEIFDYFSDTQLSTGVYIQTGTSEATISNNKFYQTAPRIHHGNYKHAAIWINNNTTGSNYHIVGNTIGFANPKGTGRYTIDGSNTPFFPMYLDVGGVTASSVQGNIIAGITHSSHHYYYDDDDLFVFIYIRGGFVHVGDIEGNLLGSMTEAKSVCVTNTGYLAGHVYGIYYHENDECGRGIYANNRIGGISMFSEHASLEFAGLYLSSGWYSTEFPLVISHNTIGGRNRNSIMNNAVPSYQSKMVGIRTGGSVSLLNGNVIRNLTMTSGGSGSGSYSAMIGILKYGGSGTDESQLIVDNVVHSLANTASTTPVSIIGMRIINGDELPSLVARNFIHSLSIATSDPGGSIIGIDDQDYLATYQNNMIRLGIDRDGANLENGITIIGINKDSASDYYYNTVYIGGRNVHASEASTVAFTGCSISSTIENNIFVNARSNSLSGGKHYAISIDGSQSFSEKETIDYNIFSVSGNGGVFGRLGENDVLTLENWRAIFDQDSHSLQVNPALNNPTGNVADVDLHLGIKPTAAEGAGIPIDGITVDFDGQIRDLLSPADIGADAGNFSVYDLSAPSIHYTTLENTSSRSSRTVEATILDATGVATGTLSPRIYYTKNSADFISRVCESKGVTRWACPLAVEDMGGVQEGDIISYFVIAQDTATPMHIDSNPGGAVAKTVNFVKTPPLHPNSYTVLQAFSGEKFIGTDNDAGCPHLNYATLSSAAADLNDSELTGPATLILCDETYPSETFPIVFEPTIGSSPDHTVIIRPYKGLTTSITGHDVSAIIKLDGADNITINGSNSRGTTRNLTLINSGNGNTIVWIGSRGCDAGATNNTVMNCILQGDSTASEVVEYGIVAGGTRSVGAPGYDNREITIQNNLIRRAETGLEFMGESGRKLQKLNLKDNVIGGIVSEDAILTCGLSLENTSGASIEGNIIRKVESDTLDVTGISLSFGVINTQLIGNIITGIHNIGHHRAKSNGIVVDTRNFNSTILIANNVLTDIEGNGGEVFNAWGNHGIQIENYCGGIKLYYNSVNLGSGSYQGYNYATINSALYINATVSNLDIRDNVFSSNLVNTANPDARTFAVYSLANRIAFLEIDNNDYFASGEQGVLGFINGSISSDLENWRSATGRDKNSIVSDPFFNSSTNLQPDLRGSPLLGAAVPIATVRTDILGRLRDLKRPTIGAYEESDDSEGPVIEYVRIADTTDIGSPRTLTGVTITDYSGVNGAVGYRPRLYYKRSTDADEWYDNSAGSTGWKFVEATGSVSPFTFDIDYSLLYGGTGVSVYTIVQYFIIAQDLDIPTNVGINSGIFTRQPNSVSLPTWTFPMGGTINSYMIREAISGDRYVGVSNDANCPNLDYDTITEAVQALNAGILTGPVIYYLCDELYPSETFPITLDPVPGSSETHTTTIKPYSGLTTIITGSIHGAIIKLNGADFITIDGSNSERSTRDLSVINTFGFGGCVIWIGSRGIESGATGITVENCILKAGSYYYDETYGIYAGSSTLLGTPGADNDRLTIRNNQIGKAVIGLAVSGTSDGTVDDLLIEGNILGDDIASETIVHRGMVLDNVQAAIIKGNTIKNIQQYYGKDVGLTEEFYEEPKIGISMGSNCANSRIIGNKIVGILFANSSYSGGIGIDIDTMNEDSDLLIANNVIADIRNSGYGEPHGLCSNGVRVNALSGGIRLFYNSVNLGSGQYSANISTNASAALSIEESVTGLDIRNNVFATNLENVAATDDRTYALYSLSESSAFSEIDHNDYVASGPQGILGYLNSTPVTTLDDFRTTTGQDVDSISRDPLFNSPTNLQPDLGGSPLLEAGVPLDEIGEDILGISRDPLSPTIGAYENDAESDEPQITYEELTDSDDLSSVRIFSPVSIVDESGVNGSIGRRPRLYYKRFTDANEWLDNSMDSNGWKYVEANGAASPFEFRIDYTILSGGTGINVGTIIQYFVVAQDLAAVPNVGINSGKFATPQSSVDLNESAFPIGGTVRSYAIIAPFKGTRYIGVNNDASCPDLQYDTLSNAINDLNSHELSGALMLYLCDETYPNETFPIEINSNPGSHADNRVTIKPYTGLTTTISAQMTDALIKLNDADYMSIDGSNSDGETRDLILENTYPSYAAVLWIGSYGYHSGSTHTIIENCVLKAGSVAGNTCGIFVGSAISLESAGVDNDDLTIRNNLIQHAYYGLRILGPNYDKLENLLIEENSLGGETADIWIGGYGIVLEGIIWSSVRGNTISNVVSESGNTFGIVMSNGCVQSSVIGNIVSGIRYTGEQHHCGKGIELNTGDEHSDLLVANNVVTDIQGLGSMYPIIDANCGIQLLGTTGNVKLYFNSVNLGTNSVTRTARFYMSAALYIENSVTSLDIRNNVFAGDLVNGSIPGGFDFYALYSLTDSSAFTVIDFNDYFASGIQGTLGYLWSTKYTTINNWRYATHQDGASISVDPLFNSSTNLIPHSGSPLIGAGISLPEIQTDILGVDRDTTHPTIGAYELEEDRQNFSEY